MKEKDIQFLLAKYPDEFCNGLVLKGVEVPLGSYRADVVFVDKGNGQTVIAEIKRGILRREHITQALDYYGEMKKKSESQSARLLLVANTIPEERRRFLEELGVQFLEIPAWKVRQVAEKHSYTLSDEPSREQRRVIGQKIRKMEEEVDTRKVWIFQANPSRYDVLNALADESVTKGVWEVNRFKEEIRAGDLGIIWMSGDDRGIYAIAEVTSSPRKMRDPDPYWIDQSDKELDKLRIEFVYRLRLVNAPILGQELKNAGLQSMSIFTQRQGTNFKVTSDEWRTILGLLGKHFNWNEQ